MLAVTATHPIIVGPAAPKHASMVLQLRLVSGWGLHETEIIRPRKNLYFITFCWLWSVSACVAVVEKWLYCSSTRHRKTFSGMINSTDLQRPSTGEMKSVVTQCHYWIPYHGASASACSMTHTNSVSHSPRHFDWQILQTTTITILVSCHPCETKFLLS